MKTKLKTPADHGQVDHGSFVRIAVGDTSVDLDRNDRIASSILSGKPFEPNTLHFFGSVVRPGSRVIDIGCYSGLFAIAAMRLGASAIGFEPLPDNFNQIQKNQRLNNAHFLLASEGLSDKRGRAKLKYNPDVRLTSGASLERKTPGPSIEIEITTLDLYMKSFHFVDMPISVIKMDVERHEPAVIRGARLTIDAHRPVLIIEANDLKAREEVVAAMEGLNYKEPLEADVRNLLFIPN